MRLSQQFTAHYIDLPGDDPAGDWVVFTDDYSGGEAVVPCTGLAAIFTAAVEALDGKDGGSLTITGEPFQGQPAQDVTITGVALDHLPDALTYFRDASQAGSRPEPVQMGYDTADDMLRALGITP